MVHRAKPPTGAGAVWGSGPEVAPEPAECALPGAGGRVGMERLAVVAVEPVRRVGVAVHLGLDLRAADRVAQRLAVVDGDPGVEVAEVPLPRRAQVGRDLDQRREPEPGGREATAVERDGGTEV